ncbi:hypothetical protein DBR32_01025 [Taibaiella sp. KBW10]|uniref:DUF1801 domain-containing protein n=1 Tax=Taibaiella sp. KBW10 TaxID=2153357 RepID=UPI000F5B2B56|nr:DUF1801 domain-containing protein [Taibaiella sp. KBW10]RQO32225.1 hypothetical protein DBR32_01025 [Taibaiella sp. KBW10]
MALSKHIHNPESVTAFIQNLAPEFALLITAVRQTILNADPRIGEHIKWNAPSFFYIGALPAFDAKTYQRDLLVIHTQKDIALLIFPTGDRIPDSRGILEGNYTDGRRMITIHNMQELQEKAKDLQALIQLWIQEITAKL